MTTDGKQDIVKVREQEKEDMLFKLTEGLGLDWRKWSLYELARVLRRLPQGKSKSGGFEYLTDEQAVVYAARCFELDVSPFSSEVWFNRITSTPNLTLEGKRTVARKHGYQFGPPVWTFSERPFPKGKEIKGYDKDVVCTCEMEVKGWSTKANYTVYLSEAYQPNSSAWQKGTTGMLKTRSQEKAYSASSGVGASELEDVNDLTGNQVETQAVTSAQAKPVEFVKPPVIDGEVVDEDAQSGG